MDHTDRDLGEFFYCEKDDSFISRKKFPPQRGFMSKEEFFVCPICETKCEKVEEVKVVENGEE